MSDTQGVLDFPVTFTSYTGTCKCGQTFKSKRCSIALEMFIVCSNCGKTIQIGKVVKSENS